MPDALQADIFEWKWSKRKRIGLVAEILAGNAYCCWQCNAVGQ